MCQWKHKTQPKHDSIHTDGNHLVNNMLWWREMGNGYASTSPGRCKVGSRTTHTLDMRETS